jgi:hypothetical protein
MTQRVIIYARYSSDLQSPASIEDQLRICRTRAEKEGWHVVEAFTDHPVSGATTLRPGYQALLETLRAGGVDIVLAEGWTASPVIRNTSLPSTNRRCSSVRASSPWPRGKSANSMSA